MIKINDCTFCPFAKQVECHTKLESEMLMPLHGVINQPLIAVYCTRVFPARPIEQEIPEWCPLEDFDDPDKRCGYLEYLNCEKCVDCAGD